MHDLNTTIRILKLIEKTVDITFAFSDSISKIKDTSTNRPRYSNNLFEYFGTDEPVTSWAICHILSYTGSHKSYPLLRSFIAKYLSHLIDPSAIKEPLISCEKYKIDISVFDKDFAIIFENKLKGAPFQRNQLGRYIHTIEEYGYKPSQIAIVILPTHSDISISGSVWRLPADWYRSNSERLCAVENDVTLCKCDVDNMDREVSCARCIDYKIKFSQRSVVVSSNLTIWLEEIIKVIPEREYSLMSHISQLKDYLKSDEVFKTNEIQKLNMEIQSYIQSRLFTKEDSLEIKSKKLKEYEINLEEAKEQVRCLRIEITNEIQQDILKRVMNRLDFLPQSLILDLYHTRDGRFSGFKTDQGFWIGIENEENPEKEFYVTIYSPSEDFKKITRKRANEIFARAELEEDKSDDPRYVYKYTNDPESDLIHLLIAANELGYELK